MGAKSLRRKLAEGRPSDRLSAMKSKGTILAALAFGTMAPGCAHKQLQFNTARQSETVIELQYQQILDNLAMSCLNPSALPTLTVLKTGATQVGDTGSLGFLGVAGINTAFGSSPTVAGTRSIVDQWSSTPITDENALKLLRKAFRSALGDRQLLDLDEAEDLAHDLSSQIGTTADMSVDRETLSSVFSQSLLSSQVLNFKKPDRTRNPTPGTPEAEAVKNEEDLYLEEIAGRIAEVNRKIDEKITSTLDDPILVELYKPTKDGQPRLRFEAAQDTCTGLAKETIYRVNDLQETLEKIRPGCFRCGPEKPRDACYVGHATFCGRECYVWVCDDGLAGIADLTLAVLKIESAFKDVQVVTAPSGIQFAPALTNPSR